MCYKNLSAQEQVLFNKIERIFIEHPSITRYSFSKVCLMLSNKYLRKNYDNHKRQKNK